MADPLRIVATLHCRPGTGDQGVSAMRNCVAASREEQGCIEYAAYRAKDAPDRITVVELWESQAALDVHNRSSHLAALVQAIREQDLAAAPLEVLVLHEIV